MARANLNKSVWLVTNTTTASKYIPNRTRICVNWNPPFQTQIYLVKVPLNVNIVKQGLLDKNFMKWGLKGGISIDADSGPPRYVLSCCGGICCQPDTFIQIGSGHTHFFHVHLNSSLLQNFNYKSGIGMVFCLHEQTKYVNSN